MPPSGSVITSGPTNVTTSPVVRLTCPDHHVEVDQHVGEIGLEVPLQLDELQVDRPVPIPDLRNLRVVVRRDRVEQRRVVLE